MINHKQAYFWTLGITGSVETTSFAQEMRKLPHFCAEMWVVAPFRAPSLAGETEPELTSFLKSEGKVVLQIILCSLAIWRWFLQSRIATLPFLHKRFKSFYWCIDNG